MSKEAYNPFEQAIVPEPNKTRAGAREFFTKREEGAIEYEPSDLDKLINIKSILDSKQVNNLFMNGKLTIGIVKPSANEGMGLPDDDEEATNIILDEVGRDRIMLAFSKKLTKQQAEKFYLPNRETQEKRIIDDKTGLTVWDSVVEFTQSDSLTFLIIYDKDGNAINWWREKMGATNPDKANNGTIRRNHATAIMLPNNLVHGSDSIKSALREKEIISEIIGEEISRAKKLKKQI